MAKAIMIQGTGSHVGKSTLVTALCRIFARDGYAVAPFKAQNMALNAYVTSSGGEMGRAQAVQALASGVEPRVEMNPVLLKATSDLGAQVVLLGRTVGNMRVREYQAFKPKAWEAVRQAYAVLSRTYDLIVIEGAGSPAEVNLKRQDISNMRVARMAKAPVILVGDIDRGGVFASLLGTLELLTRRERARVRGFLINKFRGDPALLENGLRFLRRRTGQPVLGVFPFLADLQLEEEDGVALERMRPMASREDSNGSGLPAHGAASPDIAIAVVYLPRISNFTDFDPFRREKGVELFYVRRQGQLSRADVVILPGSKNTIEDLLYLRRTGLDRELLRACERGCHVVGICGGMQMLGRSIRDPGGVESVHRQVEGLGLLEIETTLVSRKVTAQVQARVAGGWMAGTGKLSGYEIHVGRTRHLNGTTPAFTILKRKNRSTFLEDGAIRRGGRIWGTYLHGLFENDHFREQFLKRVRHQKRPSARLPEAAASPAIGGELNYREGVERELDRLAQAAREHLDLKRIYELL